MHILVISDAWLPQINGVVRTYEHLGDQLRKMGHSMDVIGPSEFRYTIPMPGYKEIRLAVFARFTLPGKIREKYGRETHIHIATEGPLGQEARRYCVQNNIPFSTCYHTEFPDYLAKRVAKYIPGLFDITHKLAVAYIRKFHSKADVLFVATESLERKLRSLGYKVKIARLTRGINFDMFHIGPKTQYADLKRPVAVCVARVAIEKNLEAFFSVAWDGTKVMVGDGPDAAMLKEKYPDVVFTGRVGSNLGEYYRSADIFAFPSKTDTFGMVLTEALASGLPVAAYPVTGPVDIVTSPELGALNDDLGAAMHAALASPGTPESRFDHVMKNYTWDIVAKQFLDNARV